MASKYKRPVCPDCGAEITKTTHVLAGDGERKLSATGKLGKLTRVSYDAGYGKLECEECGELHEYTFDDELRVILEVDGD